MFIFPLQEAHFRDIRLRKIARRTLLSVFCFLIAQYVMYQCSIRAALVALTTSSINIAVLTIKHGDEMGWICLASCGLDVRTSLCLYLATYSLLISGDSQCHRSLLGDWLSTR